MRAASPVRCACRSGCAAPGPVPKGLREGWGALLRFPRSDRRGAAARASDHGFFCSAASSASTIFEWPSALTFS